MIVLCAMMACAVHGADDRRSSWSLGITGDVNLNPALTPEQRANASFVWGDTIDVTRAVDLFMINHESTFAGVADKDPATIQFEDPLNYTHAYAAAGVGFVSLANNHQYDFGFGGLNRTLAALSGLGVPVAGWPRRSAAAVRRPRVVALPGGGPKVAVFTLVVDECYKWPNGTTYLAGCTCGANADPTATPPYQCYAANDTFPGFWYRFGIDDALIADARGVVAAYKAAHPAQLVVVYLHMGPNFLWQPYAEHEHMLRNISAAGADLVWGTSSHHVQRFEITPEGKPIVYGLGDFLFRHVVGVQDWCPAYARPCAQYRPDLSLFYVFDVVVDAATGVPSIALGNTTAYGTVHDDFATRRVADGGADAAWLEATFNRLSVGGATLVPDAKRGGAGAFEVRVKGQ